MTTGAGEDTHKTSSSSSSSSSNPTKYFRPARTILRIKRRRDEEPIPCIRLEGVVGGSNRPLHREGDTDGVAHDGAVSGTNRSNHNNTSNNHKKERNNSQPSAVLWKRFEPGDDDDGTRRAGVASSPSDRFRIVNAMLVDDSNDTAVHQDDDDPGRRRKRRKLTLLDISTTTSAEVRDGGNAASNPLSPLHSMMVSSTGSGNKSSRTPLRILDPLTRLVDDSLRGVLVGTKRAADHYGLLTTDPRFALQPVQLQKRWLTWSHSSGGNLLHCCALWNDSATSHEVLQQSRHRSLPGSSVLGPGVLSTTTDNGYNNGGNNNNNSILSMMEAIDGDGRTPYEVAQLVGHQDVCQVLEAYGGDTTNYVYDIFLLDEVTHHCASSNDGDNDTMMGSKYMSEGNDGDNDDGFPSKIMTAELTSGVGYWTPEGELVLEADEKCSRSLSYETDGEIDSNCEEYGGNDYPDEEDDGEDQMREQSGVQIGNHAILQGNGDGFDDNDYEDGRLDQLNDNYDEYDWEQDLGDGKEHSYYDESHYDVEDDE